VLFEKGPHGRDKVCGDGLTPRAVAALEELGSTSRRRTASTACA
jgi:flavin-dependent dehydrogenase